MSLKIFLSSYNILLSYKNTLKYSIDSSSSVFTDNKGREFKVTESGGRALELNKGNLVLL
jgi:hypothetical protein